MAARAGTSRGAPPLDSLPRNRRGAGGAARSGPPARRADPAIRLALLTALHASIDVLAADRFGSFGGDEATALHVVAPTFARAMLLENLSGVHLYATLVVALPVQAEAIRSMAPYPRAATRSGARSLAAASD